MLTFYVVMMGVQGEEFTAFRQYVVPVRLRPVWNFTCSDYWLYGLMKVRLASYYCNI